MTAFSLNAQQFPWCVMRFKRQTFEQLSADLSQWRRHFCIFPIRFSDEETRWLEWVERRAIINGGSELQQFYYLEWIYRDPPAQQSDIAR